MPGNPKTRCLHSWSPLIPLSLTCSEWPSLFMSLCLLSSYQETCLFRLGTTLWPHFNFITPSKTQHIHMLRSWQVGSQQTCSGECNWAQSKGVALSAIWWVYASMESTPCLFGTEPVPPLARTLSEIQGSFWAADSALCWVMPFSSLPVSSEDSSCQSVLLSGGICCLS